MRLSQHMFLQETKAGVCGASPGCYRSIIELRGSSIWMYHVRSTLFRPPIDISLCVGHLATPVLVLNPKPQTLNPKLQDRGAGVSFDSWLRALD